MTAPLRTLGLALLDLIFPPRCPGCARLGELFCPACRASIRPAPLPACRLCGRPLAATAGPDAACDRCRSSSSHLDGIRAAGLFVHPLREAIHQLKYENGVALAAPLAAYMAEAWSRYGFTADLIVPVPLHRKRIKERGYNQSALLARELARSVRVTPCETVLIRKKHTRQQVGLGVAERRANVEDAFEGRGSLDGSRIVLVDDVCTTGSTLEAAAAALRNLGASSVWGFTLARAFWEAGNGDAHAGIHL